MCLCICVKYIQSKSNRIEIENGEEKSDDWEWEEEKKKKNLIHVCADFYVCFFFFSFISWTILNDYGINKNFIWRVNVTPERNASLTVMRMHFYKYIKMVKQIIDNAHES